MGDGSESTSTAKVRELIFAYESHSNSTQPLENYNGRPRAKSIGNALSYKLFRQPNVEFATMIDIEKELVKIEAHLNYYEIYEKETHVAFQEQLFNVLTSIVSIDPEDHEGAIKLKKKLIQETQKLATDLNSRLPFDGSHFYKGLRRTYNSYIRKDEAVVSTTSVKTQEHRAVLSSHNSTLNGGYRSEESLNSTKDSLDLSSRQDELSSVDLNYAEERSQISTPPPQMKIVEDAQSSRIPSVSKLKQFFSFRKETKPETRVISGSYSGLTRSQSLNVKANKYTAIKRDKNVEERKREEAISENDEVADNTNNEEISTTSLSQELDLNQTITSNQSFNTSYTTNSSESNIHIEPVKETESYLEPKHEEVHNVSVLKLKGLFEKNQSETSEGLGLLTKKQNEFRSDFDLPYTAMNLGAYRLKRTISGNYMNFTGLLRNVDVNKKGDLSKSKSLSDLKITNFSYGEKDLEFDNDLSKEIDDDDDFEHVSIDVGKDTNEVNNNAARKEQSREVSISESSQTVQRESERIYLSKSVEALKQTFENLTTSSGHKTKDSSEDTKHVLYKTRIEPVPVESSVSSVVVEPVLKVPLELRTSFTSVNQSENASETNISKPSKENDAIRHILHRTIEPIPSSIDGSDDPKLKVPIQLRSGLGNENLSQRVSSGSALETKTIITQTKDEPVLKIPAQLRVDINQSKENSELIKTNSQNEETTHKDTETSTGIVETVKQISENTKSISELNDEEVKAIIYRTIEPTPISVDSLEVPVMNEPIQLRTGLVNVSHPHENLENRQVEEEIADNNKIVEDTVELTSPGSVETLTQTFETIMGFTSHETSNEEIKSILHRTIEPIPSRVDNFEEPVLKVPIQLRSNFVNESKSHEVKENLKVEGEIADTNKVVEEVVELSSPGSVEILTQTFETIMGVTSTETGNEEIKSILHRTIEPVPSSVDKFEEPVLKVPIQLRSNFVNESKSHEVKENLKVEGEIADTNKVVEEVVELSSPGSVEILTQTFETIMGVTSTETGNEEIKSILHRTIEPVPSSVDKFEEPVLKVPIQLRSNFVNESKSHEVKENLKVVEETAAVELSSPGTVETLAQTFENLSSISSSAVTSEEQKPIVYRTIESPADDPKDIALKVPIQLRTGFANVSHSYEVAENAEREVTVENKVQNTNVTLTLPGTLEVSKQTYENFGVSSSGDGKPAQSSEKTLPKIPLELRTEGFVNEYRSENEVIGKKSNSEDIRITSDIKRHEKIPVVDITFHNNDQEEAVSSQDGVMSMARIEDKTASFMDILEEPTEFSTIVSSSSSNQSQHARSSSKVSVSYSEKKTFQQTSSTHVSQRIVSSSSSSVSSQQSSQNYLQVLKEPVAYCLLKNIEIPREENIILITEVEDDLEERQKPKVNLNVSQENIIEEILKETDLLDNVDEEFEKMLEENSK